MDLILFIFMFLILLAETFFFQGNVLALVIAFIVSVAYIVFRIWLGKKMPKKQGVAVRIIFLVVLAICIFLMGTKGNGGGFILYGEDTQDVCTYIHKGDFDKAAELISAMEQEYGESDTTHMLAALNMLSVGLLEEAYNEYRNINDKNDMTSIVIAEQIYQADSTGDSTDDLYDLYCRAADLYPEWEYIQLCAGVMKIDFKQYRSAQYYLYNAYSVNPSNPQTSYFLGLTHYKLGDEEKALFFFNESVETGADDTIRSLIKYYLDEMDYWSKERA